LGPRHPLVDGLDGSYLCQDVSHERTDNRDSNGYAKLICCIVEIPDPSHRTSRLADEILPGETILVVVKVIVDGINEGFCCAQGSSGLCRKGAFDDARKGVNETVIEG
jgi:hypothetical protein